LQTSQNNKIQPGSARWELCISTEHSTLNQGWEARDICSLQEPILYLHTCMSSEEEGQLLGCGPRVGRAWCLSKCQRQCLHFCFKKLKANSSFLWNIVISETFTHLSSEKRKDTSLSKKSLSTLFSQDESVEKK
jgi:hypothetical protein